MSAAILVTYSYTLNSWPTNYTRSHTRRPYCLAVVAAQRTQLASAHTARLSTHKVLTNTKGSPPVPEGSGSVLSDCTVNGTVVANNVNGAQNNTLATGGGDFVAANPITRGAARSQLVARYAPAIAAYNDAGDAELEIDVKEVYLMATYALPVVGTVPRPLSSQFVFDHITLLTKQLDNATTNLTQQFTIPVNTTRIIIGCREGGTPSLAQNRELLGQTAGKLGHDGDGIVVERALRSQAMVECDQLMSTQMRDMAGELSVG
eukprot:COSAG02_NODE_3682_length_6387_cov_7.078244_2_plen_262_part_00